MNKGYDVLKIYAKIYIYATLIIGIMTIVNYESYGEAAYLKLQLGRVELMLILILQCISLALVYPIFIKTRRKHLVFKGVPSYKFRVQKTKIHIFVFILLLAQIIFTLRTGNGVVSGTVNSSISFLFNIFKIQNFMPIYYIVAREPKKKNYWINIVLYCIYQTICGWTGFILLVAFYELYLFVKYSKNEKYFRFVYKWSGVAAIGAFSVGAYIYKYAYAIKNTIRYGYDHLPLSYFEGLEKLVSRLTNFPVSVLAVQNHAEITQLYQNQGVWNWEVLSIFRSLVPGFIMPNKTYRTFSNIVLQSLYSNITNTTSTGYCCWIYWANILEANFFCFILFVFVTVFLFIVSKKLIYAFDDGSGDVDILYFVLLFSLINGGSVESLFAYGYIGLVYLIPIMILLGLIKVEKNNVKSLIRRF